MLQFVKSFLKGFLVGFSSLYVSLCVAFTTICFVLALLPSHVANNQFYHGSITENIVQSSVMVELENGGAGSGVVFKNGNNTFIWTCEHVIDCYCFMQPVIDLTTNKIEPQFSYSRVYVKQPVYENGVKVGEERYLATILKESRNQDLALLKLEKSNWPVASIEFADEGFIPEVPLSVWHVGSMKGLVGINSVSEGIISCVGRRRLDGKNDDLNGITFDQFCGPFLPGSSGGGIFNKKDGKCVGLMREFLSAQSPNIGCIVPARRIREFAKRYDCEWALDKNVKFSYNGKVHVDDVIVHVEPPQLLPLDKDKKDNKK